MALFDFGTSKINTFFFLHKELIKILDVVFTGFNTGQHVFYQPDSALFAPNYDLLINRYSVLFQDDEILNYISSKNYVFTGISNFYSLTDSYEANIECWNDERITSEEAMKKALDQLTQLHNIVKLSYIESPRSIYNLDDIIRIINILHVNLQIDWKNRPEVLI